MKSSTNGGNQAILNRAITESFILHELHWGHRHNDGKNKRDISSPYVSKTPTGILINQQEKSLWGITSTHLYVPRTHCQTPTGTHNGLAGTLMNKAAGCASHLDTALHPLCAQDFDTLKSIIDLFSHRKEDKTSVWLSGSLCFIYPILYYILH